MIAVWLCVFHMQGFSSLCSGSLDFCLVSNFSIYYGLLHKYYVYVVLLLKYYWVYSLLQVTILSVNFLTRCYQVWNLFAVSYPFDEYVFNVNNRELCPYSLQIFLPPFSLLLALISYLHVAVVLIYSWVSNKLSFRCSILFCLSIIGWCLGSGTIYWWENKCWHR